MNRKQRRTLGIPKQATSIIEESERRKTVNAYSVAVASVLWDMGHDKEEVQRTLQKILDRFDTINGDYATIEDYRLTLKAEAEIDIKYC